MLHKLFIPLIVLLIFSQKAFGQASAGDNQTICGSSTQLEADSPPSGYSGYWTLVYGSAVFEDSNLPNTQVTQLGTGENGLRWHITDGDNTSTDDVSITNNLPDAEAGANQTTCEDTRNMAANKPEAGETSLWQQVSGEAATIVNSTAYNTSITDLKNGTSVFEWRITVENCTESDEVSITRHEAVAEVGEDVYSCYGTAEITASIPPRGSGYWTALGEGTIQDPSANQTTVYDLPSNRNTFRWTVDYMGCSDSDELDIHNTNISVTTENDKIVCADETVISGTKPETGANGLWETTNDNVSFDDKTAYNTAVSNLSLGLNTFSWTITKNGCHKSAELKIDNQKIPETEAGNNQDICETEAQLSANPPQSGTNGLWEVDTGTGRALIPSLYNSEVSNLSRGENLFKWTLDNGNCSDNDYVVIQNNLPYPPVLSPDEEICSFEYTLVAADLYEGETGLWTVTLGSGDIESPTKTSSNLNNISSGINRFRWTVSKENCQLHDEITVTNNAVSTDAGEDAEICETEYFLSAVNSVEASGYWTVEDSDGTPVFDDPTNASTHIRNLAPGNNVLKWQVTRGECKASDIISIRNNQPGNVDAGADQVVCSPETGLTAQRPSSGNGLWTLISGAGEIDNPSYYNTAVNQLKIGENIFRWTVTDNNCSDYDEVSVTRKQIIADAGFDDETCTDSYPQLNGNIPENGQTGLWSVVGGNGAFDQADLNNTSVSALSLGDNIFAWTISDEDCSDQDEVIITNNRPTEANTGFDKEICSYATSITANEPTTGTGQWSVISGDGIIENASDNNTNVTNIPKGINSYKWTITKSACSSEDTIEITNNSLSTSTGDDAVICDNSHYLSAAEPSEKESGLWSLSSGKGNIQTPSLHNSQVTNLAEGLNKFKWTVTKEKCVASDYFSITNDLVEAKAWVSGPSEICTDNTGILGNEPDAGAEGTWVITSGGGSIDDPGDYSTHIRNLPIGTTTISWIIENNTCSDYAEISVSNNSVEAYAGEDEIVCSDEASLSGNTPISFASGEWTRQSGAGEIADPLSPQTSVSGLAHGSNVFLWAVEGNGCSDDDKVVISRNDFSISAGLDKTICGSTTTLSGEDPSSGSGIWTISGSPGVVIENPAYNKTAVSGISNDTENIFRWTVERNGCSAFDEVSVSNTFIQAYAGSDQSICGDNTVLAAQTPSEGEGLWTLVSGGGNIEQPENPNSPADGLARGDNTLRWTVRNNTCESYDEVVISNDNISSSAGNDKTVCSSSSILAADPPPAGGYGLWETVSGTGVVDDPEAYNSPVSNLQKGINTFRWTAYKGECNSGGDEITVTNNSFEAYAGEDQELGFNVHDTRLDAELDENATGAWSILSGGAFFADADNPKTEVTGLASGENTFRWRVEKNNCSASDRVIVLVKDFEAFAGEDQTICENHTFLNARDEGGDVQLWTVEAGEAEFIEPENPKTQAINIALGENIFRWSVTRNNYTSYDEVLIMNNDFDVYAGENAETCRPEYQLNPETPLAEDTGRWMIAGYGSGTFANTSVHNTTVSNMEAGSNFYRWEVTRNNCTSSDTVEIFWNRPPIADFYPDFSTVDAPQTVIFFNTSDHYSEQTPADVFYWQTDSETFETTYSPHIPASYNFEDNAAGDSLHTIYLTAFDNETQCSDTSSTQIHVFYSASGINKHKSEKVLLYPNPAKDVLHLRFPEKGNYRLRITDTQGNEVFREIIKNRHEKRLNISPLPAGIYTVEISGKYKKFSGKIIVRNQ